jgi:amidase
VQSGEVTPTELLETAIERSRDVNPSLNAIVIPMEDIARKRARDPLDGPFAGVPFLIKDLYQDYAGVQVTSGCAALCAAGHIAKEHSEIVARWLRAGTVIFGRTNTPEFGAKGITEPAAWGPTRNPWDPARSPGGSSGGAAAAVAAGIVPMAGASDGGGSIRIPAAYTGLFGLKPGRGRTPTGPVLGEALHGAALNHVLTRSVRDSAAMLDATHGPETASLFHLAEPAGSYAQAATQAPRPLRIGFSVRSPIGSEVHADVVAGVERTARLLESLGHHVEEAEPSIDGNALARDFCTIWFAQLAVTLEDVRALVGEGAPGFEMDTLAMAAVARADSAVDYAHSHVAWVRYTRELGQFLSEYDLLMTPTVAEPPPTVGERTTPQWAERAMQVVMPLGLSRLIPLASGTIQDAVIANLSRVPFTQLANVTGVPAMSVPVERFSSGLPLGIQLMASHGGEALLLSLAGQLEQAAPWRDRKPPL